MSIYSRIVELSKISGDTMYSLSRHSGVSESILSRIKINPQARLSKKSLILLANYFCVNELWLETGEGYRDAPGLVRDSIIHDQSAYERFVEIARQMYGDDDGSVDSVKMSTYTTISRERLYDIINDNQFPTYSELISLLKSNKELDANWLLLGVDTMFKHGYANQRETARINSLVDTITTLQETINIKNDIISTLNEKIKQLENKLKQR